jgi:hypothetical protein
MDTTGAGLNLQGCKGLNYYDVNRLRYMQNNYFYTL